MDILLRLQLHVAAGLDLAVDTFVLLIAKADCAFLYVALAGCRKFALYLDHAQPHGGIVPTAAVHALHIRVLGFQVDQHAVVGRGPAVAVRRAVIVQDTDGGVCGPDYTGGFIGIQHQGLDRVQVALLIFLVSGYRVTLFGFQPDGIAGIHCAQAQHVVFHLAIFIFNLSYISDIYVAVRIGS